MAAAVAVFVKTPARSPVKTRLAAQVGATRAQAVYVESLRILRSKLQSIEKDGIFVYWAVAEEDAVGDEVWADFPTLWTGDGSLGQRLHQVYARLRQQHGRVLLIGADCPQLPAATLLEAAQRQEMMVGPASDGGFYLFAAGEDITNAQWLAPAYSEARTLEMLLAVLAQGGHAPPALLPVLTDIDDCDSLERCIGEFADPAEAEGLQRLLRGD